MSEMEEAINLRWALLLVLGLGPSACGGISRDDASSSRTTVRCSNPQTLSPGLVSCDEGYVYRSAKPAACPASLVASQSNRPPLPPDIQLECTSATNLCDVFRYGYCADSAPPDSRRVCVAGCGSDADCQGGVCTCSAPDQPGTCLYDSCYSDQDCGTGYHCASTPQGCGSTAFTCQTAQDSCISAKDCGGGEFCTGEPRRCSSGAICGRPFLVAAAARVAAVAARDDWSMSLDPPPRTHDLSDAERARRTEHWTRLGQLEHASIAAFARFQLQLLQLAAPPELVEACTRALADETAHARLCFAIASAFAGRPIGPGPLDVSGSLHATSLIDVLELVVDEGCIGETNAALEALEAARTATDPALVSAYTRIARDEQRHAELAFRFVQWALDRDPSNTTATVQRALAECHSPTFESVAGPCLRALIGARARAESAHAVSGTA